MTAPVLENISPDRLIPILKRAVVIVRLLAVTMLIVAFAAALTTLKLLLIEPFVLVVFVAEATTVSALMGVIQKRIDHVNSTEMANLQTQVLDRGAELRQATRDRDHYKHLVEKYAADALFADAATARPVDPETATDTKGSASRAEDL